MFFHCTNLLILYLPPLYNSCLNEIYKNPEIVMHPRRGGGSSYVGAGASWRLAGARAGLGDVKRLRPFWPGYYAVSDSLFLERFYLSYIF